MKIASTSILLTALLGLSANTLSAQTARLEPDAIITDTNDFPRETMIGLIDPAVSMIRAYGYRCDSISAMRPFLLSRGFTVVCNGFAYEYDISDKGGNWVVELQ